jgi:hypothetical protein
MSGSMKYPMTRFKSLKIALKEMEPFIRNGRHLATGRPFKQFGGMRSREVLAQAPLASAATAMAPKMVTAGMDRSGELSPENFPRALRPSSSASISGSIRKKPLRNQYQYTALALTLNPPRSSGALPLPGTRLLFLPHCINPGYQWLRNCVPPGPVVR